MNRLVLVLVLVLEDKPPIEDEDEQDDEDDIGTMNHELERRRRQGAAGILPAVLFSVWSAGKMPAALWGS